MGQFTNRFAQPFKTPKNENWKIALHSISSSNNIYNNKNINFLKIQCDEIQSKFYLGKDLHIHARKHYHPERTRVHTFTPLNKEYFDVTTDELTSITIKISADEQQFEDQNRKTVKFYYGPPTIVTLHLKKFDSVEEMDSPLTIRVGNRKSKKEIQPANNFKVDLPAALSVALEKSDKYEIALSSITYQPIFEQFSKSCKEEIEIGFQDNAGKMRIAKSDINLFTHIDNPHRLISRLNHTGNAISRKLQLAQVVFFDLVENNSRVRMTFEGLCYIKLPYQLSKMMGNYDPPDKDGFVYIEQKGVYRFPNSIRLTANYPSYIMLLTNFIRPSPVGDIYSPMLKTIPININDRFSRMQTFQAIDLEYHPILFSSLENLEFQMYDQSGELIPFLNEDHDVNITLFLRKK
ncbi:MAG: hypothetical protein AAFR37_12805 [Cyanobacteria bacterium J06628_3]